MGPKVVGGKEKSESDYPDKKEKLTVKTFLYLEATVRTRTTPVAGLRSATAAILSELSDIPNLQILPESNPTGLLKSITYITMIPRKFQVLSNYVVPFNDIEDFTCPIAGNKPCMFKIVMHVGLDISIDQILEENAVNMAQNGVLMEKK